MILCYIDNQAAPQRPGQRPLPDYPSLHKIHIKDAKPPVTGEEVKPDTKSIRALIDPNTAFLPPGRCNRRATDAVVAARVPLTAVLHFPDWACAGADDLPISEHIKFDIKDTGYWWMRWVDS